MKKWISWCATRLCGRRPRRQSEEETVIPSCLQNDEEDCLICYELLTRAEWKKNGLLRLNPCGHIFHLRCFYPWLHQKYYTDNDKPRCIKCRGVIESFDAGKGHDKIPLTGIVTRSRSLLQQEKKRCRIVVHVDGTEPVTFYGSQGIERGLRAHLIQCLGESRELQCAIAQVMSCPLEYHKCIFFHHLPAYFYFSKS